MTVVRVVLSFAAVGGLLWLFARAGRGRFGALLAGAVGSTPAAPLEVLDRRQLTRNAGVALVRAGSRHLLVGVGESGIQLLTEGDDLVTEPPLGSCDPSPTTVTPVPQLRLSAGDLDTSRLDTPHLDTSHLDTPHLDPQSARTRLSRATTPSRPRTSLVDALREKTVRRS